MPRATHSLQFAANITRASVATFQTVRAIAEVAAVDLVRVKIVNSLEPGGSHRGDEVFRTKKHVHGSPIAATRRSNAARIALSTIPSSDLATA